MHVNSFPMEFFYVECKRGKRESERDSLFLFPVSFIPYSFINKASLQIFFPVHTFLYIIILLSVTKKIRNIVYR